MPEAPPFALAEDPRWIAYRDAAAATRDGLSAHAAVHERYRQSLMPYCELLAEHCGDQPLVRQGMMCVLFERGMPLGIILGAFRASKAEADCVREHPPTIVEPVDEIERLQRMSYGRYLRTPHWLTVQTAALAAAEYRCRLCNSTKLLEVHHRDYKRIGCERPADVIVLCGDCHSRHHGTLRAAS